MRSLDLSPLLRYSIGFDRLDEMFESASRAGAQDSSYPPYNILKIGDDAYRITLAIAGFTEEDLEVVTKENVLSVRGRAGESESEPDVQYLHRGIARRAFEHRFQLADHVKVTGASLESGLLDIDLVREIPEAKKPQTIRIGSGASGKAIERGSETGSAV
jgi:molecular chaperone IbpA